MVGSITTSKEQEVIQKSSNQLWTKGSLILNLIALSRFRTIDLYRFLSKFISRRKRKPLKMLRAELSKTVPESENLSHEIVTMREDRF